MAVVFWGVALGKDDSATIGLDSGAAGREQALEILVDVQLVKNFPVVVAIPKVPVLRCAESTHDTKAHVRDSITTSTLQFSKVVS